MDPRIGSSYGPYVVEEVIARGGQGVVLKTRHSQRGVPAALKILLEGSDLAKGRFLREMETLRLLADHPGLPTPYDLGEHEGTLFIALELVEGRSLQEIVRSGGALPEPEALRLAAKTARIVAQCHDQGVLHRDLKPANVILRESGAPCVVDFGVARVEGAGVSETSRLSVTGDLIGTPAYMAPEQVSGEGIGFQTDVYGLGSILYFLLSGQQPVSGTTSLNVLTRLARDATPDVRKANPAVSAATAELLLQAMAKEPAERIQSAEVLAEYLEALSRGEDDESSRLPLLLAAVGALVLLAAALAFAMKRGPEPSPATAPASPSRSVTRPLASRAPLRAQAPGTPTWATHFEGSAVLSHALLGPWALVESAPLLNGSPQRKLLQTRLVSLEEGSLGPSLPRADLWCWDSSRQRAIGHAKGRLFSVSPRSPNPKVMAEGVGALCSLAASSQWIYTTLPHLLQIRDAQGKVLREVAIPGHAEVPPLALDLDPAKPGPDHLLVVTTGSAALLLTMDGRERASTDLPGPISTLPLVLRAEPESAEIGLVSGAGILTRLEARARNLRLLGSWDLGATQRGRPLEPRGPLLVDRDPAGAPRQVFLQLLSGIACLSPDLSELRWRTGHPAGNSRYVMTGLRTSDLNRDGTPELSGTFVPAGRKQGQPRQHVHLLFGPQGRAISTGALHLGPRSAESLPDGSLLLSGANETLVRWGPWTGLPDADASLAKAPRPGSRLRRAKPLELLQGDRRDLQIEKTDEGSPYMARLSTRSRPEGPEVEVVGSKGVQSAWLVGGYGFVEDGILLMNARLDVNYLLLKKEQSPAPRQAWLELDLRTQPKLGPAFVEIALALNDRVLVRTTQAYHRKGLCRISLGEINQEGYCSIQVHVTSRSRAPLHLRSVRLVFEERR